MTRWSKGVPVRMTAHLDLESCAYALADRYRSGSLPDIVDSTLTLAWKPLIRELRSACPGFTDLEYGIALNKVLAHHRDST